jgi:hypothetical protein
MRIARYVRVSTSRQARTATIEQQLDRLQAYCLAPGWAVPAEHLFRDVSDERPILFLIQVSLGKSATTRSGWREEAGIAAVEEE